MSARVWGSAVSLEWEEELESLITADGVIPKEVASRSEILFQRLRSVVSTEAGRAVWGRNIDGIMLGVKCLLMGEPDGR